MDDAAPTTTKSGLSGIDIVGYLAIFAGAASLLIGVWITDGADIRLNA
jgi:uncharacterized membrane protein YiaA